jgi:hypothetical protein
VTVMVQDALFGEAGPEVRMLTVRQPWAWALIYAAKNVENRSRYFSYRGTLVIHAGQSVDPAGVEFLRSAGIEPPAEALAGGYIVGRVEVTGCTGDSTSRWARAGAWHIQVSDPEPAVRRVAARGNVVLQRPPAGWEHAFSA